MKLSCGVEGKVADMRCPRKAVAVIARLVLGKAKCVCSGLLELRVGCQRVVRVVDASEHHLGKVAKIGTKVDVTSMIVPRWRVCVKVVEIVGRPAFLAWMLVVKVKANPNRHVAALDSITLEHNSRIMLVCDDLVHRLASVPIQLDHRWRR
jgi:hypothetical protein